MGCKRVPDPPASIIPFISLRDFNECTNGLFDRQNNKKMAVYSWQLAVTCTLQMQMPFNYAVARLPTANCPLQIYFGASLYNQIATNVNMIFGVQAASNGGKLLLVEKVSENLSITT